MIGEIRLSERRIQECWSPARLGLSGGVQAGVKIARPRTSFTISVCLRYGSLFQKCFHSFFVDYFHTQFPGFVELGTSICAGNDIIRLIADRGGYATARIFNHFLGLIATIVCEGAG